MTDVSTVSRTFAAEPNRIAEIRDFIEDILGSRVSGESLTTFKIIADEILANVSMYAYDNNMDKWLEIRIRIHDGAVFMSFVDAGKPFDPTSAPDPDTELSVEEREFGGLGIYVVKNLADEMSYFRESGLNILTIKKKIQEPAVL
ncbi:MAG: ATP-binding protein [Synergistaceae bacterium]|jgi:anti-sigma regulatory factor (Ser/Thr protein kinase)|nr:ATP-binding protein [Synergistaceae bacterium]